MAKKRMKLGEMLLEAGFIDEFQLTSALSHQRNCSDGRLGASLVKLKYISEESLLNFLSEQLNLPRLDLSRRRIPPDLLAHIPAEKAWEYRAIPVDRKEMQGTSFLLVAMADPTNLKAIDALQFMTGCRVRPALAFESAIDEALINYYGPLVSEEDPLAASLAGPPREEPAEIAPLSSVADSPPAAPPVESTEEKLQQLLKILLEKGILSLRDCDRLK